MPPAARIGDMHVCPMVDGVKPHVGGPVLPPGQPNVLIGGLPAATVGNMCTCVGAPDIIAMGSTGVLIGGMPAARMGDTTAHGGKIILGCFTVLIGEVGSGGGGGGGGAAGADGAVKAPAAQQKNIDNANNLKESAKKGEDTADKNDKKDYTAQFKLLDGAQKPKKGIKYNITTSDGKVHDGKTDDNGQTQVLSGYTNADCKVNFLND